MHSLIEKAIALAAILIWSGLVRLVEAVVARARRERWRPALVSGVALLLAGLVVVYGGAELTRRRDAAERVVAATPAPIPDEPAPGPPRGIPVPPPTDAELRRMMAIEPNDGELARALLSPRSLLGAASAGLLVLGFSRLVLAAFRFGPRDRRPANLRVGAVAFLLALALVALAATLVPEPPPAPADEPPPIPVATP